MKYKKIIIGIMTSCILMSHVIVASATVPTNYINQELTKSAMDEINNRFTDSAKQEINHYTILIVNKPIYEIPGYTHLNSTNPATINLTQNEILVYQERYGYGNSRILYHELGHCLDHDIDISPRNFIHSETFEYRSIAKEESDNILPYAKEANFLTDIHEQFAECFSLYSIDPVSLKNIAPKTFDYLEKIGAIKQSSLDFSNIDESKIILNGQSLWKHDSTGWWYKEENSWATGWRLINGTWYYFYSNGYMAANTTVDGFYINENGAWIA